MSVPFLTPPFLASLAWSLAVGPRGYLGRLGLSRRRNGKSYFLFLGAVPADGSSLRADCLFRRPRPDRKGADIAPVGRADRRRKAGTNRWSRILLPIVFPALLAGGFLAFACAIEEYGTPLVIGNRIGFPVISTEIGRIVRVYPINLTLASALASLLFALAGGVYFTSYLLQRGAKTSAETERAPNAESTAALGAGWPVGFVGIYFLFTIVIPYGSMLLTSLLKLVSAGPTLGNLTSQHYLQGLTDESSGLRQALVASFALALMAALLGTLLGAACARRSVALASLALIPAATPAITMAVGFIRGWNAPWTAWLPLYGSVFIVGLFYTAQYLPYAVQYARSGLAAIPPSYEWAARIHGAGAGMTTRRIIAPLALAPLPRRGNFDFLDFVSRIGRIGAPAPAGDADGCHFHFA